MAVYAAKLALQDAAFPLLSRNAGRPVFIPNLDSQPTAEPTPQGMASNASSVFNKVNRPHVEYCENVLPRNGGFNSVGYIPIAPVISGITTARFALAVKLYDAKTTLLQVDALFVFSNVNAKCAVTLFDGTTILLTMPLTNPKYISYANVLGDAYFLFSTGTATYIYKANIDAGTGLVTWAAVVLVGIADADKNKCIFACSAGNYLILCKGDGTLYWNNPNSVLDYTPSLVTGAGFGIPAALVGQVISLQSQGDGFILHTTNGNLFSRYSQNAQYPWIYTPCYNSVATALCKTTNKLAHTDAPMQSQQFAWTSAGMSALSLVNNAVSVFPEVSDFLASELIEVLSPSASAGKPTVVVAATDAVIDVSVVRVGNRYLWFSYGQYDAAAPYFTQCLVYDIALKRWGKLVKQHVCTVELPTAFANVEGLHNIGIVDTLGNITAAYEEGTYTDVSLVEHTVTHEGVVIIGGISLVRMDVSQLNSIEASFGHLPSTDNGVEDITVSYASSLDGINLTDFVVLPKEVIGRGTVKCGTRKVATYHFIKFYGNFHLTEGEILITKAGIR